MENRSPPPGEHSRSHLETCLRDFLEGESIVSRILRVLLSSSILSVSVAATAAADEAQPSHENRSATTLDNTGPVSAPVMYKKTMLIVVTPEGVAAIIFEKPSTRGTSTEYRYRFQPADGSEETTGNGRVYERLVNEQYNSMHIKAGKIVLPWSGGGAESGWVYYSPEDISLQIANSSRFTDSVIKQGDEELRSEKLDLRRYFQTK